MAHDLETLENGESTMAFAGDRKAIWHGLGQNVEGETLYDVAAMMRAAHADYEVGVYELQTVPLLEGEEPRKIPDVRYLYRKDDMRLLASVGPNYKPLQNSEAFANFQPWLDLKAARLDTCGVIGQGRKAWLQGIVNIPPGEVVKGDEVEQRILLANTFDGMTAINFGFCRERVVCKNTLGMAIRDKASSQLLKVRHNRNVAENVSKIAEIMDLATAEFRATIEQYRFMAAKGVNEADMRNYVKAIFGYGKIVAGKIVEVEADADLSTRSKNYIDDVLEFAHSGVGQNIAVGSTWWAYNSVNGFLTHKEGRDQLGSRRDRMWFGANAKLDKQAFEVAFNMANAA